MGNHTIADLLLPLRRFVLFTASQLWGDEPQLDRELHREFLIDPHAVLVHGACEDSPDMTADRLWTGWGGSQPVRIPAAWEAACRSTCRHGQRRIRRGVSICQAAGPYRNRDMVDRLVEYQGHGHEVEVMAFLTPSSKGAKGCAQYAERRGLHVQRFQSPDGMCWPERATAGQPDGLWSS